MGTIIPNDKVTKLDICTKLYEGQTHIQILSAIQRQRHWIVDFGFLAGIGNPDRRGNFTFDISPVPQEDGMVEPYTLKLLESSSYKRTDLRAIEAPIREISNSWKNPHKMP